MKVFRRKPKSDTFAPDQQAFEVGPTGVAPDEPKVKRRPPPPKSLPRRGKV